MDSTTLLEQIDSAQAEKEVTANALFDALSPAGIFGRHAEACSGLTWGYYGGRWGGSLIPNGTLTLAANATNYVMVDRSTGTVQLDDGSPLSWSDIDIFAHLYVIVTGAIGVTSYEDHRCGAGGLFVADVLTGLPNNSIANGLLADMASQRIKGRTTAGTGDPEDLTPAQAAVVLHGDGLTVDLVGFRGIPGNSQTADYTLVASDAGKCIDHPSSDNNARTFTIPANSSVAFPVGTTISFDNDAATACSIAVTSDTLEQAGTGSTGTRTLGSKGVATIRKVASTKWRIFGVGVT